MRLIDTVGDVITWLLFLSGIVSLMATASALIRFRHPASAGFVVMMSSLVVGEYPLFHLVSQMAVAGLLIGGTDKTLGVIGLSAYVVSWVGLLIIRVVQTRARPTADRALIDGLGPDYLDTLATERRSALRSRPERGLTLRPLHFDKSQITFTRNLSYGPARRNRLDIYQPKATDRPLPVIVQIHGGAWVVGHKAQQAQPLLHRLASNGYVCVSINYRLAPKAKFPDPLIDVKQAIAWVRDHIRDYGGDPNLIILTGGSAGGHLASLAALTPNDPKYQPGFEASDTSVVGCMPFYGPSDFTNQFGIRGVTSTMEHFLRYSVMPGAMAAHRELYEAMSPITHVHADAPPFLITQGKLDVLVWREEQRAFVDHLSEVSNSPVVYWEVPGAQHAFDTFNSNRSAVAVDTCERFAGWTVARARAMAKES